MKTAILKKIVIFGVVNAMIALTLACLGFGIVEFYKIKRESLNKLNTQMDVLAYNLQSTLVFDDKEAANKTLRSLENDNSINNVTLYKADGTEFASYVRWDRKGTIQMKKSIFYNDKLVGWLEINSFYAALWEKLGAYLMVCFLIIIISIPASHFISAPIRKQVSLGVLQLEEQSNRLRMLAAQVANTEQMERKRIAAIIHDHLQQILVACKLQLGLAVRELGRNQQEKASQGLTRVDGFIDEATRAAKTLTVELRPPVLYEDGLGAAFQWLANKFKNDHGLDVALYVDDFSEQLPDTLKIMIFESVKELLFNVVKYADVQVAELFLKYESNYVIVVVKDKGKGFDIDQIEKASSDKGFGLFSIRERLKLLNGRIKISSEPSKGTAIELRVPLSAIDQPPEQTNILNAPDFAKKAKEKKINILLVDDHKLVREGIANILKENASFNVIAQAENGVEAVEKAEVFMPDVVIMDINMPKLNGIEATRAIKMKFPNMDVIGLSVQEENHIMESMKKAGAVTLLNKAGDPQELIKTINTCKLKRLIV